MSAAAEPPIDTSLDHYMEERALAIALGKAASDEERACLERLLALRAELMPQRQAYLAEATARRHARGEVYSAARVASINAMAPSRAALDRDVEVLYEKQPDARGVLEAHARTHFVHGLVTRRLLLPLMTPDIAPAARAAQDREERFARAWVAAIGDARFAGELREQQRQALVLHRTSSRPMFLVGSSRAEALDDESARDLGKAWTKLDTLAQSLGVEPLSTFIAFADEGEEGDVPASRILAVVDALAAAAAEPGRKIPAKRSALAALAKARTILECWSREGARAHFEVD